LRLSLVVTRDRILVIGLAVTAAALPAIYFLNRPVAEMYPDSPGYLQAAQGLLHGQMFNVDRLPGYPALLALLGGTAGTYGPVLIAQTLMFVVAVVLTYQITLRAFGHTWIAFATGLMMATDAFAAAYARFVLSEALALCLVSGMAAASVSFVIKPRASALWGMAALATASALTRPEWVLFPLALAAYCGLLLAVRGIARRFVWHGLAAVAVCYLVIGGYVAGNGVTNGYLGTTELTNVSLLGKVLQYNMQDEAPASLAYIAQIIDSYPAGSRSAWVLVVDHPSLERNHYELAGTFARAVITRDPLKYLQMSVEVAIAHTAEFDPQFATTTRGAPFDKGLLVLKYMASARYFVFSLIPAVGLVWLVAPLLRRRGDVLDALGPVALIVLYGTLITALGGFFEYGRYHIVFLASSVALTWGTLGFNAHVAWTSLKTQRTLARAAEVLIAAELIVGKVLPLISQPGVQLLLCGLLVLGQGTLIWFLMSRHRIGSQLVAVPATA
jgi:hypothetical protein